MPYIINLTKIRVMVNTYKYIKDIDKNNFLFEERFAFYMIYCI